MSPQQGQPVERPQRASRWGRFPPRARFRLFVDRPTASRTRRASDVLVMVVGIVALAFLSLLALPPSGFERIVAGIVAAFPSLLDGFWRLLLGLMGWWAGIVAVVILITRRWALLKDVVLSAAVAVAVGLLVGRVVQGQYQLIWDLPFTSESVPWIPWLRVTVPVAVLATASPFLVKTARTFGLWIAVLGVIGGTLLSVAPSLILASAVVALIASSAIHLLFGSSIGWPEVAEVEAGLDALGVQVKSLRPVERQKAGVYRLHATSGDDRRVDIKVYGRDASDTQFLNTLWRRLFFRGFEDQFTTSRLHQVEHEAFLTLLASRAGVPTQSVVMGGLTPSGDAILVLEDRADFTRPESWDEEVATALWQALGALHNGGIAHNQINSLNVVSTSVGFGLVDYRTAVAGADPWRISVDRVQTLVTTAAELGPERAIAVTRQALSPDEITAMLPLLQDDLIGGESRRALKSRGIDIDDLREETANSLGIDPPELEQLRRVTVGSVLKTALPIFAFFALASVVAGLDFDNLTQTLNGASWWLVGVALVLAQTPRFGQAVSAMGASPVPLPLGRVYLLQLAQGFVALTVPSSAARIAMNVRFMQRHGLPGGTALAVGALDGFSGFLAQIILVLGVLAFTSLSINLDLDANVSSGLMNLVLIVAAVALLAIIVLVVVPRFRDPMMIRIKQYLREAREAIRGLGSPRRLGLLLGGNMGTELMMAVALGVFALAVGYPVGLPELLLISVLVSLLAGLLPVPGGVGVYEGGLILGLTRAGVPEDAAFAAAIMFRAATFYLPPIWGYFAFRWLERRKYL